ncbi:MAG: metalloregulator ArsR/SmtB family transcription factor, partial [Alphaproteobacteria bacterium]|nr:metalloregulator ArsR/SmtB family transcription factor [Alphaproteobacteria bacterium]
PTRIRLLALCAEAELTVTDLTQILGQSQPRVSRHLKLLCDAGLLDRVREGSWVFYRLARGRPGAGLAERLAGLVPGDDALVQLDRERLDQIRRQRASAAAAYFDRNAENWHRIRALHIDEREVERVLLALVPAGRTADLLDIGTGTGRMLEIFAPRVGRALGLDLSREMLAVARANLDRAALRHCAVRWGDMYKLPLPAASFDLILIHQVLHFAEHPALAIGEAARVLRPSGRLIVVDFAPHAQEELRDHHAHRRLGFAEREIADMAAAAGLAVAPATHLPGHPLTVTIWQAQRPPIASSAAAPTASEKPIADPMAAPAEAVP